MMRNVRRSPWWAWLLMGIGMLGCGNLLGVVQSAQEVKGTVEALVTQAPATAEAFATSAATALPPAAEATPSAAGGLWGAWTRPDTVAEVQAYRARWEYTFTLTDTGETTPLVQVEWAVNKAQNAEQMKLVSPTDTIEVIRVGSQAWLYSDQAGWIRSDAQETPAEAANTWDLWDNAALGEVDWQTVGPETVEGMATTHYRWVVSQSAWAPELESWVQNWGLGALYTLQPAGDGQLDAWVTPENWLVRIEAQWPLTATDNAGTAHPAVLRWVYTVQDVNGPVDIQPPAEAGGEEPPLPVPTGAQLQSAVLSSGTWMYLVPDMDLAGIQAFYREQAQAGALTLEGEMGGADMGFWQATAVRPDGARYRIMASHDEGGVALLIQQP